MTHYDQALTSPGCVHDFSKPEGQQHFYDVWLNQQIGAGYLEERKDYTLEQRSAFFADWLRWLIKEGNLNPYRRLPPYEELAALPFDLSKQNVAHIIRQLREEKVLPRRKQRKDADKVQLTRRDEIALRFIGEMRAVSFVHMQRLLARESPSEIVGNQLSLSRTCRVIDRYERAKLVIYQRVYYQGSGWIFLTRRGLTTTGLDYRAEPPSPRLLEHLFWINEVRLNLEDAYPEMYWISERSIQAQQELRVRGISIPHISDGIVVLPHPDGTEDRIDIEVQMSRPSQQEVEEILESSWTRASRNPLWYFVTKKSRGTVHSVHRRMEQERQPLRPSIQIIDLEEWTSSFSEKGSSI